jgi:hypothetical protein
MNETNPQPLARAKAAAFLRRNLAFPELYVHAHKSAVRIRWVDGPHYAAAKDRVQELLPAGEVSIGLKRLHSVQTFGGVLLMDEFQGMPMPARLRAAWDLLNARDLVVNPLPPRLQHTGLVLAGLVSLEAPARVDPHEWRRWVLSKNRRSGPGIEMSLWLERGGESALRAALKDTLDLR